MITSSVSSCNKDAGRNACLSGLHTGFAQVPFTRAPEHTPPEQGGDKESDAVLQGTLWDGDKRMASGLPGGIWTLAVSVMTANRRSARQFI